MKINFWIVLFISIVAVAGLESTIYFKMQADRLFYQRRVLQKTNYELQNQIEELERKVWKLENPSGEFSGKLEQMKFGTTYEIVNALK